MKGYCGKCGKVIDEVEIYKFKGLIVCDECYHELSKEKSILKRYLCFICKLNETCQNNFDYECVETSDFLFKPKSKTYIVEDDSLDKFVKKAGYTLDDHNGKELRG